MADWAGLTPPYTTICVDPPWRYKTKTGITTRTSHGTACAADNYTTMSNQEISELPVGELAAPNAHLYLWVTNPKLYGAPGEVGPDGILAAWGFRYVTMLTWAKTGTLGLGFYFRGQTEHVLFGVKGSLPIPVNQRQRNLFTAQKSRHSVKPGAFYDLVERASPGPYVELFTRQARLGWDAWGWGYQEAVS